MLHLAHAIMIACDAALSTPLRGEGAPPRFIPGLWQPVRANRYTIENAPGPTRRPGGGSSHWELPVSEAAL
jgi:hypothetical protein